MEGGVGSMLVSRETVEPPTRNPKSGTMRALVAILKSRDLTHLENPGGV